MCSCNIKMVQSSNASCGEGGGGAVRCAMLAHVLAVLLAADPAAWERVSVVDGVTIEQRPVADSRFVELRFTTTSDKTPASLCAAAFGDGSFDPQEPDLKSRKVVESSADERLTYDQITPPLVSNRDYLVRARVSREPGDACRMTFEAASHPDYPPIDGWVRITKLRGYWRFEPKDGKTSFTYVVFSDPGGAIPPFMAEGSRRTLGVKWVKLIEGRGKRAP